MNSTLEGEDLAPLHMAENEQNCHLYIHLVYVRVRPKQEKGVSAMTNFRYKAADITFPGRSITTIASQTSFRQGEVALHTQACGYYSRLLNRE
jgi:hypothetical protein